MKQTYRITYTLVEGYCLHFSAHQISIVCFCVYARAMLIVACIACEMYWYIH